MTQNGMDAVFQTGIILGRITQFSIDRGVVLSFTVTALSDLLTLFSEEIQCLPVQKETNKQLLAEIGDLFKEFGQYQPDEPLKIDDSRIMVGFVSRWTEIVLNELAEQSSEPEL